MAALDEVRVQLNHALESIGHSLGTDIVLGADDSYLFEYQGTLPLALRLAEDSTHTPRTVVAAIVAEHVEEDSGVFATLLEYNWFGLRTGGTSVAWNRETKALIVWASLGGTSVNDESVRALLEQVIFQGLRVKEELSSVLASAGSGVVANETALDGAAPGEPATAGAAAQEELPAPEVFHASMWQMRA